MLAAMSAGSSRVPSWLGYALVSVLKSAHQSAPIGDKGFNVFSPSTMANLGRQLDSLAAERGRSRHEPT
jgi:hypothetical protein